MNDEQDEPIALDDVQPNAADPVAVQKRQTKAVLHQREVERFWQRVFEDPVGRSEIWQILQDAHAFETRFMVGPTGFPDPNAAWFHAGVQTVGQALYKKLATVARAGVLLMQDEHDPDFVKRKMPQRGKNG